MILLIWHSTILCTDTWGYCRRENITKKLLTSMLGWLIRPRLDISLFGVVRSSFRNHASYWSLVRQEYYFDFHSVHACVTQSHSIKATENSSHNSCNKKQTCATIIICQSVPMSLLIYLINVIVGYLHQTLLSGWSYFVFWVCGIWGTPLSSRGSFQDCFPIVWQVIS